ncbi:MAG: hypothetical protein KBH93_00605 [Anaerolineae bacterium]|nr:hypothetical protein [Anaerolineae bacterium]
MSQQPPDPRIVSGDAKPVPSEVRRRGPGNGSRPAPPPRDERPVPPLSLRALVEERNWTALVGLGLIGVGLLIFLQDVLHLHLRLWALLLLGVGGWLAADGWSRYERAGRVWDDTARSRALFGVVTALVGFIGLFDLNWWGLLLIAFGGKLGHDTWRRYASGGRRWTAGLRRRAFLALLVGGIGLLSFFSLGSAGPLLLILVGVGLFIERASRQQR